MKKIPLALLALSFLMGNSCKKKPDTTTTPAYDSLRYSVNNLTDITINQYKDSSIMLPIMMEYLSGIQEPLTISLSGLPAGATATPASIGGTPTFTGTFTINYYVTTSGTFPITVTTASSKSGTKTSNFNLIVTPRSCSYHLVGNYDETSTCNIDSTAVSTRTMSAGSDDNHILVKSRYGDLNATLNCSDGTFTIPQKILDTGFIKVSASGTFNNNKVIINWTKKSQFAPFTETYCKDTWTKK